MKTIKEIQDLLTELRSDARRELHDISKTTGQNCFAAGYEVGKIDIINEIKAFIKEEEYDFGKDY